MKKLLFMIMAVLSLACVGCSSTEVDPGTNMQTASPSDDAADGMVTDSNGVIGDSDTPVKTK